MKQAANVVAFLSGVLAFVSGCQSESVSPVGMRPISAQSSTVQESEHFYMGSDGYYHWDGQPPPGDQGACGIYEAKAGGHAPYYGTGGWISGSIVHECDQGKVDLVYSMTRNGDPYYSNAQASSGWMWALANNRSSNPQRFDQSLNIVEQCGYALTVGGTGHSRKAIPFGLSISLMKFSVSIVPGTINWGDNSQALQAFVDNGILCDEARPLSECDNASTPETEYCPVNGDPAAPPGGGGGGTATSGFSGGTPGSGGSSGEWQCVYWTDWFVSYDGGNKWYYDYRQCHEYGYVNEQ